MWRNLNDLFLSELYTDDVIQKENGGFTTKLPSSWNVYIKGFHATLKGYT